MILKIAKWVLWLAIALTVVLIAVNTPVGIGMMALDVIGAVVYGMYRSACDRRQLHHVSIVHRI